MSALEKECSRAITPVELTARPKTAENSEPEEEVIDSSLLSLPIIDVEFANEKLQKIEACFIKLAGVMARITPQLFKENKHQFDELDNQAHEQMLKVQAMLISFEAKVRSEYTNVPFSRRLVLWFISLFSERAYRIRMAIRKSGETRDALLAAAEKYDELLADEEEKIGAIRHAKVRNRQKLILLSNKAYQDLVEEIANAQEKHANAEYGGDTRSRWYTRIQKLETMKTKIEDDVFQQALAELSEEL